MSLFFCASSATDNIEREWPSMSMRTINSFLQSGWAFDRKTYHTLQLFSISFGMITQDWKTTVRGCHTWQRYFNRGQEGISGAQGCWGMEWCQPCGKKRLAQVWQVCWNGRFSPCFGSVRALWGNYTGEIFLTRGACAHLNGEISICG